MSLRDSSTDAEPDPDGSDGLGGSRRHIAYGVIGLLALAVLYYFRPWIHGIVYPLVWAMPNVWFYVITSAVIAGIGHAVTSRFGYTLGGILTPLVGLSKRLFGDRGIVTQFFVGAREFIDVDLGVLGGVFLAVFLLVIPMFTMMFGLGGGLADIYAHEDVADRMHSQMDTANLSAGNDTVNSNLPRMNASNARIVPRAVADKITSSSVQYRTHRLSDSRVMFAEDGSPQWAYAVEPDGLPNTLRLPQRGTYALPMDEPNARPQAYEGQVTYGMGENPMHDWKWKAAKTKYGADYREAFPVVHNGETYIVAPYVTHQWKIGNPLEGQFPVPYSVPKFGGVVLIHPDGEAVNLQPQEAATHPVLEDQNYYPYSLARYEVNSMQWQHGSINRAFFHEDQLELAEMPAQGNEQPFVVWAERGEPVYYIAAEPWGGGSGVYQIYTFDAQRGTTMDGGVTQFTTPDGESLLGPDRATGFAMRPPEIKRLTDVEAVEPIPVVRDDGFYWMVRVVPNDSSGISAVVFVDAQDRSVAAKFLNVDTAQDVQAIKDFIRGERDSGRNVTDGDNGQQVVVTITVANPDGSTDETVNVTQGQSITIETHNATRTNNSTATGT